jgi:hypothetical protein
VHFGTDNKTMAGQTVIRDFSTPARIVSQRFQKEGEFVSRMNSEHQALTAAGWSYRMNYRGWVIYRHPQTGLWYTRQAATVIVEAEVVCPVHRNGAAIAHALSSASKAS